MPDTHEPVYGFHPLIADSYLAVHRWLQSRTDAQGYRSLPYSEVPAQLCEQTMFSAAAQFHTYFPAHFFKVCRAIDQIITQPRLVEWLYHNPHICVVDVGCGAGAASVAFIQAVLRLQETDQIENPVDVYCLGVDPNPHALGIYNNLLKQVVGGLSSPKLSIAYTMTPKGIPSANTWIARSLDEKRKSWQLPCLAHTVVTQVNVVSPLDRDHGHLRSQLSILADLGVSVDDDTQDQFGFEQAYAYKSILELVSIDHMHIMTISTDTYQLAQRVGEMGKALERIFDDGSHNTLLLGGEECQTTFINPRGGRFGIYTDPYSTRFHVNVVCVTSQELCDDREWHEVTSTENLRLAWARTRHNLLALDTAFIDEIEIRLFESDLERNLATMKQQLMAYACNVARIDDYVAYRIPKSPTSVRPRVLSSLESEVLSVAIIQRLGSNQSRLRHSGYAYHLKPQIGGRDTEYLYESWFPAYERFTKEACEQARDSTSKAVLRVDIKSFYTRIAQDKLIELTSQALTERRSRRVEWLIRLLLSRNLDDHEIGKGIVQGSIGSGFYANIYLTAVDALFGEGNEWGLTLYRFVDDMILVIPTPEDGRPIQQAVDEVKQAVQGKLGELELELNEDKTEVYYDMQEFIRNTEPDDLLAQIGDEYMSITNRLWILDANTRDSFAQGADDDELWWYRIRVYCQCLRQVGIYVTPSRVSRWIHRYLFSPQYRQGDLGESEELVIGDIPSSEVAAALQEWSADFEQNNAHWLENRQRMHRCLTQLFRDSWDPLHSAEPILPYQRRQLETRLRFALNKLVALGLCEISDTVVEVLLSSPWITKQPGRYIEGLAYQGYGEALLSIFSHYEDDSHAMNEYLRAVVLRAMRFLPELYTEHWELIVRCAIQGTLVEQMMATETWLYLSHTPGFLEQVEYVDEIRNILTTSPAGRLSNSYMLLVSQYGSLDFLHIDRGGEDTAFYRAYDIGREGETSALLTYIEPSMLRRRYYGGRSAGDSDAEHMS